MPLLRKCQNTEHQTNFGYTDGEIQRTQDSHKTYFPSTVTDNSCCPKVSFDSLTFIPALYRKSIYFHGEKSLDKIRNLINCA